MIPQIQFIANEVKLNLKQRNKLKTFLFKQIIKTAKRVPELNYIFCSDAYLLQMNKTYLQHDTFTDIITFDLSDHKKIIQGEIYISIDQVKENAKLFKCSVQDELLRVIFHGALHLCGYKDKNAKQQTEMRKMEDLWISVYKKLQA